MKWNQAEKLLNEYQIRTDRPGIFSVNASIYFSILEREIEECDTLERLEEIIRERLKTSIKPKDD